METPRATWTAEDIILALWSRGVSLRRLAKELGTTPNTLKRNIETGRSARIRAAVSAHLSTPEWHLWPAAFPPQWREGGPPTT